MTLTFAQIMASAGAMVVGGLGDFPGEMVPGPAPLPRGPSRSLPWSRLLAAHPVTTQGSRVGE